MQGGVLVLDLSSTITGWARYAAGMNRPDWSHIELPSTGEDIGRMVRPFEKWLDRKITEWAPTLIAYECPFIGPRTSQTVAKKLMGLLAYTEGTARRRGCGYWPANIPQIRKHFLGANPSITRKGKTKEQIAEARKTLRARIKTLSMLACSKRGWEVANNDEADSLALLDFVTWKARATFTVPWDNSPAPVEFFGQPVLSL